MNSALKPVLPQPQPGQASPAKANVATANHSALPAGAAGALGHAAHNLALHPAGAPPAPHAAPSMAPVSANMAQMAHNMSHHGNLSQPAPAAAPPSKPAPPAAPLSLVQDKPAPAAAPLALTRTPEKKDPEPGNHSNGTVESPKAAANAPGTLKPLNQEPKEKQDIAKTSPSTPKPPEKPASAPNTPQKSEAANAVGQADCPAPAQAKVIPANEAPEKSPAKPAEPKPAPTADVAPSQSDSKPAPEAAKDSSVPEKQASPQKPAPVPNNIENAKPEPPKVEEKKEEPKPEKPAPKPEEKKEEVKPDTTDGAKKEEVVPEAAKVEVNKVEPKVEEKKEKVEAAKTPAKPEVKASAKPTMKLATVTTPVRKRRQPSLNKSTEGPSSAKKLAEADSTADSRAKRNRTQVQLYQSPTPELAMATKLSAASGRSTPTKPASDDKLIVFYKNEYLAVRNAEGGFYVCQTVQNVYRNTRKIKIRWLSQDKVADPSGETYKPDFYDVTDMECVLTTLSLTRSGRGVMVLAPAEAARARSILQRALRAEQGAAAPRPTEEHPDGLDLSLYKDESQLEKKSRKRKVTSKSPRADSGTDDSEEEPETPSKKARTAPKRSPRSAATKPSPKATNKRKSAGSTPVVASTSKVGIVQRIYRNTAAVVTEKAKAKATPKRTPAKQATPKPSPAATPKGKRRAPVKEVKPIVPTPSTSTGKATRTPRKPPAKK
ncbi:muscle M-line assembly protein unc-89 isoform X1 [Plutella xylostella]|uniref:muscle M-line assembly protein unc-89 isoform X1 n=1 Tax=Plutella xylostella TaxID=51655 RepID=UPI0020326D14|nr:muscle M-line assembly protein unc-89 isoform X1 [Plutella xylostella]